MKIMCKQLNDNVMFMKAKVLFNTVAAVILLLVLCGCREEKNCDFDRLVLNNKALEREIIEYRKREDDTRIYTINGTYIGNDKSAAGKGIYITGGKKIIMK